MDNNELNVVDLILNNIGSILIIISFFIPKARDLIVRKFQQSLDNARDINNYNYKKKYYISKVRFDNEFAIYKELSDKQITLVFTAGEAVQVVRGMFNSDKNEWKNFIDKFTVQINDADIVLKTNAPFISKEIFDKYRELDYKITDIYRLVLFVNKCENEVNYEARFEYKGKEYDCSSAIRRIEQIQKEVSNQSDEIIKLERDYLNSLDVIN